MTTITSGNKEFLAVDVQYHSAKGFRIHGTYISFEYLSFGKSRIGIITIPHGNYKIIGLWGEIKDNPEYKELEKHSLTESTLIIEKI